MPLNPLGFQNPWQDVTEAQADAILAAVSAGFVRHGAGGGAGLPTFVGGAIVWDQVDHLPPGQTDPAYVAKAALDRCHRAGIPVAIVNINPFRASDVLLYGSTDTTTPRYPHDEAGYLAWVTSVVVPLATYYSDVEVIFQIHNEPENSEFWLQDETLANGGGHQNYSKLVYKTCGVLRPLLPAGARIMLAGMTTFYVKRVINDLMTSPAGDQSGCFDLFDTHLYGYADQIDQQGNQYPYDHWYNRFHDFRQAAIDAGTPIRPLWTTETATYSGTVYHKDGSTYLYIQTETQQARELVRRLVYPLAVGLAGSTWAYVADTTWGGLGTDGFFAGCGLRNVTTLTPKLSYYAMTQIGGWLQRVDPATLLLLSAPEDDVKVMTALDRATGEVSTILWWDFYKELYPPASMSVQIDTGRAASVLVTRCVPLRDSGVQVVPGDLVGIPQIAGSDGTTWITVDQQGPLLVEPLTLTETTQNRLLTAGVINTTGG